MDVESIGIVRYEEFLKTYYDLCHILGEYCGLTQIPIEYMMMVSKIQHSKTNELYGFSTLLQEMLHESLIEAKNKKEDLKFKHYSLIFHLIPFQNKKVWDETL